MITDYQSMIQLNPIIPFSPSGYQKARWFNYMVTSTSSIKSFQLFVYGNLAQDAVRDANDLKRYFETRDVGNFSIAIGVLAPKLDTESLAYVVQINMNVGALRIAMGGTKSKPMTLGLQRPPHVPSTDIVNRGIPVTNSGIAVINT